VGGSNPGTVHDRLRHAPSGRRRTHPGMVAAIAFESLVKLLAFIAVGAFVTWGIYDGFWRRVCARRRRFRGSLSLLTPLEVVGRRLCELGLADHSVDAGESCSCHGQFQVAVIENIDERHLKKAIWVFPAYMLAINIFVLPIAFGGRLHFPAGNVDADTFVLTLPMAEHQELVGAAGVHRRAICGHRHGDRRDDRVYRRWSATTC